jgi:hypothetical protein
MTDRPAGQRFSFTYISQGDPTNDRKEMRYRLGKLLEKDKHHPTRLRSNLMGGNSTYVKDDTKLIESMEEELGVQFATVINGQSYWTWTQFFAKLPLTKILDAITVLYMVMTEHGKADVFISEVNRIFREENIAFEVDEQGGVHPIIDGAFHQTKQATIRGLSSERYALCLLRLEEVDASLMSDNPNFTQAIRAVFGANENLFKLMFNTQRLDKRVALDQIGKQIQIVYSDHPIMQRASAQILNSYGNWVDGAHHYRHEEGSETPTQPAEELAIVMISEGMSFVRWLAAIDKIILGRDGGD